MDGTSCQGSAHSVILDHNKVLFSLVDDGWEARVLTSHSHAVPVKSVITKPSEWRGSDCVQITSHIDGLYAFLTPLAQMNAGPTTLLLTNSSIDQLYFNVMINCDDALTVLMVLGLIICINVSWFMWESVTSNQLQDVSFMASISLTGATWSHLSV